MNSLKIAARDEPVFPPAKHLHPLRDLSHTKNPRSMTLKKRAGILYVKCEDTHALLESIDSDPENYPIFRAPDGENEGKSKLYERPDWRAQHESGHPPGAYLRLKGIIENCEMECRCDEHGNLQDSWVHKAPYCNPLTLKMCRDWYNCICMSDEEPGDSDKSNLFYKPPLSEYMAERRMELQMQATEDRIFDVHRGEQLVREDASLTGTQFISEIDIGPPVDRTQVPGTAEPYEVEGPMPSREHRSRRARTWDWIRRLSRGAGRAWGARVLDRTFNRGHGGLRGGSGKGKGPGSPGKGLFRKRANVFPDDTTYRHVHVGSEQTSGAGTQDADAGAGAEAESHGRFKI
ncbi:hypothetical protein TWF696_007897 [Orbilia brochopaga]|uniref:Uncharacterized protein n=1 Tax=Orbilia brochopaga TaxID=3140254 RepID=A0AAV9UMD6_9PEZI